MKHDLTNVSFIIHYRRDSECREFNLKTILRYLGKQLRVGEIILINDSSELDPVVVKLATKYKNLKLHWLKNDGNFKKSHSFNIGASLSTNDILCFYDVDVLIDAKFLEIAKLTILNGSSDHVYPYSGLFIDVAKSHFNNITPKFDFKYLNANRHSEGFAIAAHNSHGGVCLISKSKFLEMGGFDETYIGWGFEDTDFYTRSTKCNKVGYIIDDDAICWHLHHERAIRLDSPDYEHNKQHYINANR